MATITIPKNIRGEKNLIAVPRGLYEEFSSWQKRVKSLKTFKPSVAEKKALARARKNFAQGKYITLAKLEHELGLNR